MRCARGRGKGEKTSACLGCLLERWVAGVKRLGVFNDAPELVMCIHLECRDAGQSSNEVLTFASCIKVGLVVGNNMQH